MKIVCLSVAFLLTVTYGNAQKKSKLITTPEVTRIISVLAADDMRGRQLFSPEIDRAAGFIANEFRLTGLQPLAADSGKTYLQSFIRADKTTFKSFGAGDDPAKKLTNVVGVLPGKTKPEEYVIISAHYDHIGLKHAAEQGDSIYNGANDDASGTTAVIMLAKYFKALNNNARSIIFVAFTGEESGGFGSRYFSKQLNPDAIKAMLNIEMIGTESKWGKNSAYITGYEKSGLGAILQKNLGGSGFSFYPDPYTDQHLFYRSDNATLAKLGVPAHTISTSKMDSEPNYHRVSDEVSTLDLGNMTEIIRSIAISAQSIIAGKDTPARVKGE